MEISNPARPLPATGIVHTNLFRLDGKSYVILGGGSGLGEHVARTIVGLGGRVLGVDINTEPLRSLAEELGMPFLVADARKNALEVLSLPDHHCVLATHQTVLLVCDVWEHAYYLKHQQKRADYVDCWWQVANWQEAARRFGRPVEAAA